MSRRFTAMKKKAQVAVEYMVLLGAVVAIVLIGFKNYLPTIQEASNYYYNQVGIGVFGE